MSRYLKRGKNSPQTPVFYLFICLCLGVGDILLLHFSYYFGDYMRETLRKFVAHVVIHSFPTTRCVIVEIDKVIASGSNRTTETRNV